MLSPTEKILFILLVAISLMATYNTFGNMFKIILRGQGQLRFDHFVRRAWQGLMALATQGRIIRHRKLSSLFHYGVAYGFIFYALVNLLDILEGMITGFHFLEGNIIGSIYRLAADIFSVLVIVGMAYFLLRRFAANDPVLSVRENVKLYPKARKGGVWQDSLVVGMFILFHVGFRFTGASFAIAQRGSDSWQPFANWLSNVWVGGSPAALNFGWHASWWIALALILFFLPYFPYTKHAHLFMGPFNFMTRPERTYLGQMQTLDFEDESIEQSGA
ncbi:MAG: [Fe-S]-binding protein, partial [Anaerolineae bacterium]